MSLYIRFLYEGQPHYGLLQGDQVDLLSGDLFNNEAVPTGEHIAVDEIELLPPSNPSKILAVSTNYTEVLKFLDKPAPPEPIIFFKSITAMIGGGEAIIYPNDSHYVTYEPELAVIIGRECFKVSETDAMSYIFGYSCANDLSARDIQEREIEMARCKSYSTFAPIGPLIQTNLDPSNLWIRGYVNGKITLETTTANMIFSVETQVSFISRIMKLLPGDVIMTGACGVGEVNVGDSVEIEIQEIGKLTNNIIKETEKSE
jgi:2-keto-4-pentenoate hydratase/2-oxohepta-3-ene-1,7-dioic acid hydratase in catechol pathway